MKFGFLEDAYNVLIDFVIGNFWSIIILVGLVLIIFLYLIRFKKINVFRLISFSFPKEIRYKNLSIILNRKNKKLAYNIWVELKTRKIALDFDEINDVITEVYDSWYESFKLIREYIKDIGEKSINDDLRNISLSLINETMRPHLTRFQSRFRKWIEKKYLGEGSIQDKQKDYPEYQLLIDDLKRVNEECKVYLELLEKIYS